MLAKSSAMLLTQISVTCDNGYATVAEKLGFFMPEIPLVEKNVVKCPL